MAEIEGYQKVIDGARAVVDNYRPHIPIHPDWPMVPLGEACVVNPRKSELADLEGSTVVSFVPMSDIGEHEMFSAPKDTKRLDVGCWTSNFHDIVGSSLITVLTRGFQPDEQ